MHEVSCVWDARAELGEGVFWHQQEQALYWIDIIQSQLHRLRPDGNQRSWHFPGQLSAAVPCQSGGLIATFQRGIFHIDTDASTATCLLTVEEELTDNRFNDGCSDQRGQLWFASMDNNQREKSGSFYRLDTTGKVHRIASFGNCCITNGPAVACDDNTLFFTSTLDKAIYSAAINPDGIPGEPTLHIDFTSQPGHPDGMCTDSQGGLWVCQYGGSRVTRFQADGTEDFYIDMPVPNITKCAFGGADMDTLYITTARAGLDEEGLQQYPLSGGLFAIMVAHKGLAMPAISTPGKPG